MAFASRFEARTHGLTPKLACTHMRPNCQRIDENCYLLAIILSSVDHRPTTVHLILLVNLFIVEVVVY